MRPKKHKTKPAPLDETLGRALVSSVNLSPLVPKPVKVKDVVATLEVPNQSVCDKARELAARDIRIRANEEATREQAFMDLLFPDRSQYINHGDHTYTICGLRWQYDSPPLSEPRLYALRNHPENTYRSTRIFNPWDNSTTIFNLTQFGAVLLHRDQHVEFIDYRYPNTIWGRFRLWLNYHTV